ncbi:hypothetical protein CJD36_020635 [Flavipsychrobacter stenotrophus]|uniref:Thioredoxin domain-containing protein n=1 Tax=Flavipsychrobacter stenotrophus TaxID=2077091 RepID=A0A2S7SRF6_9BACT|nr:hypothetical protein [Flavipsychrobacter stenotrophus]PQJ09195.1 hypothetical protein CJD36_020635 [Flavipsychrobacter stenotrophus]
MHRKLLAIALVLCQYYTHAQQKGSVPNNTAARVVDYEHVGSPMPLMRVVSVDSNAKVLTHKSVDNGANLLVMLFNPQCGHCEDQAELLVKNIGVFKQSKLVMMVVPEMGIYLPNFIRSFRLNEHPEVIKVGVDSGGFIKNTFLYQTLPQINIYNSDRRLIKTYSGGVSMDTLMQYIQ